jgi:hypothetical protein
MANDLQRHLRNEPIGARRPSVMHCARKWAQRHRAVVWALAACVLLASAMITASIGFIVRDRSTRREKISTEVRSALGDSENSGLRLQALEWLRADLALYCKLVDSGTAHQRSLVRERLEHWQHDTVFTEVRGNRLARLPGVERQQWEQFWVDVEHTLIEMNQKDAVDSKKTSD